MGTKEELRKSKYRFKFDKDICLGCGTCITVCSIFHEGAVDDAMARLNLSRHIFGVEYLVDFCRQCDHAECYYACPVNAVSADPKTGARLVSESECSGCESCVEACPFGMMFFSREKSVAFKCDFCGGEPQCVRLCPTGALALTNR